MALFTFLILPRTIFQARILRKTISPTHIGFLFLLLAHNHQLPLLIFITSAFLFGTEFHFLSAPVDVVLHIPREGAFGPFEALVASLSLSTANWIWFNTLIFLAIVSITLLGVQN